MEIDLVKFVENVRLHVSPSLTMENFDLSRAKRFLRWTWLRLSTRRFLARNAEAAASPREDFAAMLEDEDGADVTLIVGDRQFRAYRRVLAAASPVFAAGLFGPMEETSAKHVKIDDMDPAIFEALLLFACTGVLPLDLDMDGVAPLQHLLVAADRYGMHGLMAACEWRLCRSIDVETVASTLALADQHHHVKLKDACIGFVSTKSVLSAVRETEGFAHLVETCPLVMVDILEHKLQSRVTRFLTQCGAGLSLCGTRARGVLTRFGTKVSSLLRRVKDHEDFEAVCVAVLVFSAFGVIVLVSEKTKTGHQQLEQTIQESPGVTQLTALDRHATASIHPDRSDSPSVAPPAGPLVLAPQAQSQLPRPSPRVPGIGLAQLQHMSQVVPKYKSTLRVVIII